MSEMTIDIEEIYFAVLKRNCKIEIIDSDSKNNVDTYHVKITEDNNVEYVVVLSSNHNWWFGKDAVDNRFA